jgi:hypothetical protein
VLCVLALYGLIINGNLLLIMSKGLGGSLFKVSK